MVRCFCLKSPEMHRFGSLNPDDYGGMPSFLTHMHNRRRANINPGDATIFGRDNAVSTRLAKIGRPLEQDGENQQIQVAVEMFVNNLLKCIGKLDGRFVNTVIPSGSFYEGTKVTAPDEFDFMAEIQVLSFRGACSVRWHSGFPGRPIVKPHPFLAYTLFPDVIHGSTGLSPGRFLKAFEKTLLSALDVMAPLPACFGSSIKIGHKGPSVTLVLTWNGRKYRKMDISIDITPAIKFFHWPQWTDISATTARVGPTSLSSLGATRESYSKTLMDKVTKHGFHVVPVTPLWRASFSVAEMHIIKSFSPESNRLTCYRCAKYLRDQHKGDSYVLTSYVLKTGFLFELEKYPDEKFWSNEELFSRLNGMMNHLLREAKEEVLGSYFVSSFTISKSETEDLLPHAIQRVLDDLLLSMLLGPKATCCH